MKRALVFALLLTACATPRERIRTVEVKVPVAVRCVKAGDLKPLPPKPVATLPADERLALAVALDWLASLWPWAVEAEGQLKGCVGE
jgi:hypothetical protein